MVPPLPWDVNQVQRGPRHGWIGNRFNNQNQIFSNNQGYRSNSQSYQLKDKTERESSIPVPIRQSPLVVPGILFLPGPIPLDQSDFTR